MEIIDINNEITTYKDNGKDQYLKLNIYDGGFNPIVREEQEQAREIYLLLSTGTAEEIANLIDGYLLENYQHEENTYNKQRGLKWENM